MRKLIIGLILTFTLSACASLSIKNPISSSNVAQLESAYGVALSVAVNYRRLRLCKRDELPTYSNVCAQRSVILKLQSADRQVQVALKQTRDFISNNPNLDPSSVISALSSSITVFQAVLSENSIR